MAASQILHRRPTRHWESALFWSNAAAPSAKGWRTARASRCICSTSRPVESSAWPDRPDDFVQWTSRCKAPVRPGDFLPRQWYGEYVRDSLLRAADEAGETARLSVVLDEVRRVARHPSGGWMVHLARGSSLRADAVVLAIGHRPPLDPIGKKWTGSRARLIADPWRPFGMNVIGPEESVAILGSGLTAVDAVLSLAKLPRSGAITLISRNGLLPHAHSPTPIVADDLQPLVSRLLETPDRVCALEMLRSVRSRVRELAAAGGNWRSVVDGLRPHTSTLWRALSTAQRRRFVKRLRPFWEVHRHRMALPIAEKFRAMLDKGEVRVVAGRVESARGEENGVRLVVRPRGSDRLIESDAAWVINCTGPMPSNSAESNPVIGSLLVHGWLLSDELSLGIETSPEGHALDADGRTVSDLFVVGTLRKPSLWESTAVPELRGQAATVAERVIDFVGERMHASTAARD